MPLYRTLARKSETSLRFGWSVILLSLSLTIPGPIFGETLVNFSGLAEQPVQADARSGLVIDSRFEVTRAALGLETMLRATQAGDALEPQTGKILKEIGKQTVDQPGHFLIGAAPIWASRCLVGVPWYGWAIAPLLAYREWLQWPSNRWWDPPLDWAFLSLGAVVATCRRGSTHRLRDRLAALRQRSLGNHRSA